MQILPRGALETSTPRIVDITSNETQTVPIIENNQDKRGQGKTIETQTEMPATEKHNKYTQCTHIKEHLNQTNKPQLPSNIRNEIEKWKITVPLTELVKNESYRSQITETLNIEEGEDSINLNDDQPENKSYT